MSRPSLTEPLRETLACFERAGTPLSTSEVAARLDLGRRGTYDRLERLVEHGRLETKSVGSSARVWWRPAPTDREPGTVSSLLDTVPGIVYRRRGTPGGPMEFVSQAATAITGYDSSLVESGEIAWEDHVVDAADRAARREELQSQLAAADEFALEYRIRTASGDTRWVREQGRRVSADEGSPPTLEGVITDITERTERERELERYESIVETIQDWIYTVDSDGRFTFVNASYAEMFDELPDDLVGVRTRTIVDDAIAERARELERELVAGEREEATLKAELETGGGESVVAEAKFAINWLDDDEYERIAAVRDITNHVEHERALEVRMHQLDALSTLGQLALTDTNLESLMADAVELVSETLGTDYCKVLDLADDGEELLLTEGVGWHEGLVGRAAVAAVDDDSQAAHTLASATPIVVEDLTSETRFNGPALLRDHDVRSGISTIIGPPADPWGILGTHDTAPRAFSQQDIDFVQSVANILATAIHRHDHEQTLLRQRERVAALNDLHDVVREITDAVIEQSTRGAIETSVCEHLAASESYLFAWIGELDDVSQTVDVCTEAGVEGYLDDIVISADPANPRGKGPTARAFRTGEIQTTRDVTTYEHYTPWEDHADRHGFRSSAAVPIVFQNTVYGVLNVYADRPRAFEGDEGTVFAQLGEIVGHAIAATERKRALMNDEVVELAFRIPNVSDRLGVTDRDSGTFTIEHVVPLGDDAYAVYGSATPTAVETIRSGVDTLPHWERVAFRDAAGGSRGFELHLSSPPILSAIAAVGGSIERAVVEGGDYQMTIHFLPSTDVQRILDAVTDVFPDAQVLRHRQITRQDRSDELTPDVLVEDLTERQRTTLETAYRSGFFEWPRNVSGQDVAETLGIAPPTFHQHLRKAELNVFEHVFSSAPSGLS